MTLSATQLRLYYKHGEAIAKYDIPIRQLQRLTGESFHACRVVTQYVQVHGAPRPEDIPGATVLVIGDAHAKPDVPQERFTLLGRMIEEKGREAMLEGTDFAVVCIGDWADMESLSSYDVGKKSYEGRRYRLDIDAAVEAQDLMFAEVSPEVFEYTQWIMTVGNHEHRINRAVNDDPKLDGFMGLGDLQYEDYGWEVYPFQEVAEVNGVFFAHYFPSGVMGRAISGVNLGRSIVQKTYASCVQGHSHLLDHYSTATRPDGKRLHGLSVGCYFEHDEDYAGPANKMFWRGIVMLKNVKDGDYDLETTTLPVMRRLYGGK